MFETFEISDFKAVEEFCKLVGFSHILKPGEKKRGES
jgi:hypothetical protein